MDAEGSHVGSSLAAHPEDAHVSCFIILNELNLIDRSDTKLFLDSRNERWALEAGTCESIQSFLNLLDLVNTLMELEDGHVLLSSRLLSLDKPGGIIDADDEAARHLWIKSA